MTLVIDVMKPAGASRWALISRAYTGHMRSVADNLRDDTRRRDLAKTPAERVDQALRLGDADCELAAASRGLLLTEARRLLARGRQHRRTPSACHESLLA